MLYEAFTRIISDMCLRIGTPLTVKRISLLLCNLIDDDLVDALCMRMLNEGILVKCTEETFTTRSMAKICVVNSLITEEYQQLGMTLMRVNERSWVRYIPPTSEHRFFELKPSSIGADAGLGLFVRSSRRIPQGCVLCEYRGRLLKTLPKTAEKGTYVVRVRHTASYLDGVTEDGFQHLSLATFINDNGPLQANAAMMEYSRHPGRVFVVANRDLQPKEEIFVVYGATYWGFTSYFELKEKEKKRCKRRRSLVEDDALIWRDLVMPCRRCGDNIVRRSSRLHSEHCGDPLVNKKLLHLDCLPFHDLTAADVSLKMLYENRKKALQRAKSFVKLSEPQTFSHTHEDVVGDLEFTFKESAMNTFLSRVGVHEAAAAAAKLQSSTENFSAVLLKTVEFKPESIREMSEGTLAFPWTSNKASLNAFGTVHGGALSTLADVFTRIHLKAAAPQLHASTISLEISFLSPVFEDKGCLCITRLVGERDKTVFTDFSLEDGDGAIYARGTHVLLLS